MYYKIVQNIQSFNSKNYFFLDFAFAKIFNTLSTSISAVWDLSVFSIAKLDDLYPQSCDMVLRE